MVEQSPHSTIIVIHPHVSTSLSFLIPPPPSCLPPAEQCPPPPPVEDGMIAPVHNYYNQGTSIFYICREGYKSNTTERVCQADGVWSGVAPKCECKFSIFFFFFCSIIASQNDKVIVIVVLFICFEGRLENDCVLISGFVYQR